MGELPRRLRDALDPDAPEPPVEGHEAVLVTAAENFIGRETAAAIETVHGDRPDDCDLDGDETAFDLGKAKRPLGWEPRHAWREAEGLDVDGPDFV